MTTRAEKIEEALKNLCQSSRRYNTDRPEIPFLLEAEQALAFAADQAPAGGLDDLVERGMQAKLEAYRKGSDILHELSCNCGDETCRACIIFKALPSLGPVKLPAPSGEPQKGGGK